MTCINLYPIIMASVAPIGSPNSSNHSADSKATKCQSRTESKYSITNLSVDRRENLDESDQKRLDCSMVDCVYHILCTPICGVIGCFISFTEFCYVRHTE